MKVHRDWESRKCPSCGEEADKRLEIDSIAPAEEKSFDDVASAFIGLRSKQIFFSYYRCLRCELLYCPYYFSQGQLNALYETMPDNLMGEDKSTVSKTQSGYVDWISKRVSNSSQFLEIGPDIGLVAAKVIQAYDIDKAVMVEPNKSIYAQLQNSMNGAKKREIVQSLSDLRAGDFDLIVGVHVYDHLLEPIRELRSLRSLSSSQAALVIVVHNEKSILRRILKRKWPPFCLQHPQLFNPKTLRELLRNAGWIVQEHKRTTNWWHLDHLGNMGAQVLGMRGKALDYLPAVEIPLKVGNFIAHAKPLDV